jgi:hypothetical protein
VQLYERLLGSSYDRLPPALRRFHAGGGGDARWAIEVRTNPGRWRAAIGRILALRTTQRLQNGRLVESHGPVSFFFEVEADERGMRFVDRGCSLLGIRLPRPFAPSVSASVSSCETGWELDVALALPIFGTVLSYCGFVTPT